MKIDTKLNRQYHANDLSMKLNRTNALLFKLRKYFSLKLLRSICFAVFEFYLSYSCLFWEENLSTIKRNILWLKDAITIVIFQTRNFHTGPLFKLFLTVNLDIFRHIHDLFTNIQQHCGIFTTLCNSLMFKTLTYSKP